MDNAELVRQREAATLVYRNERLVWRMLRETALRALYADLQSLPFTAKEKSFPATLHDASLIKDVA